MCGGGGTAKKDGEGGKYVSRGTGRDREDVWVPWTDAEKAANAAKTTSTSAAPKLGKATAPIAAPSTRTSTPQDTAQSTRASTRNPDENGLIVAARQREAQRSGPASEAKDTARQTVVSSLTGVTAPAKTAARPEIKSSSRAARRRALMSKQTLNTVLG